MTDKYKIWGVIVFVLIGLFLVRQYFFSHHSTLQIVGEKNVVLIRTPSGEIISFGDAKTSQAQMILGTWNPLQSLESVLVTEELPLKSEHKTSRLLLQKITSHIVRGVFGDQKIWFIGDAEGSDFSELKSSPIGFESDIWILQGNIFPDFFPKPNASILHLGERKPSKKLETFARENKISLIAVSQTGGTLLEFKDGHWEVKVRE